MTSCYRNCADASPTVLAFTGMPVVFFDLVMVFDAFRVPVITNGAEVDFSANGYIRSDRSVRSETLASEL